MRSNEYQKLPDQELHLALILPNAQINWNGPCLGEKNCINNKVDQ